MYVCVSIKKKQPQPNKKNPTLIEVYGMSRLVVCFCCGCFSLVDRFLFFIWLSLGENGCALELIRYFSSKLLADLVEFDF